MVYPVPDRQNKRLPDIAFSNTCKLRLNENDGGKENLFGAGESCKRQFYARIYSLITRPPKLDVVIARTSGFDNDQ